MPGSVLFWRAVPEFRRIRFQLRCQWYDWLNLRKFFRSQRSQQDAVRPVHSWQDCMHGRNIMAGDPAQCHIRLDYDS